MTPSTPAPTDALGAMPGLLGLVLCPAGERPEAVDRALREPSALRCETALAELDAAQDAGGTLWRALLTAWLALVEGNDAPLAAVVELVTPILEDARLPYERGACALVLRGIAAAERDGPTEAATRDLALAVELYAGAGMYAESAVARLALALVLDGPGAEAEERAATEVERARAALSPAEDPAEFAAVTAAVGMRLHERARSLAELEEAIELLERAAAALEGVDRPLLAARVQAGLGAAYLARPDTAGAHPDRAIACLERALDGLAWVAPAPEVAALQLSLGGALQAQGGRACVLQAIRSYHATLRVFKKATHPLEYALVHANLGTAYLSMLDGGERDAMRQAMAVQSYRQALDVYTLDGFPEEHAMVQNNLGNALQYVRSTHPVENLQAAIAAYQAALEVRTVERAPIAHARTQANLANALRNFPAEERELALLDSVRAYETALDILQANGLAEEAAAVGQALSEAQAELIRIEVKGGAV